MRKEKEWSDLWSSASERVRVDDVTWEKWGEAAAKEKSARKRQKMRENDQRMMFEEWKKRIHWNNVMKKNKIFRMFFILYINREKKIILYVNNYGKKQKLLTMTNLPKFLYPKTVELNGRDLFQL